MADITTCGIMEISIHALAKRATNGGVATCLYGAISIHALAKRATRMGRHSVHPNKYFNPRPRKEGDCFKACERNKDTISIHALAKRATR